MKKIFLAIFILVSAHLHAQLNNSWIDYNKTYYMYLLEMLSLRLGIE